MHTCDDMHIYKCIMFCMSKRRLVERRNLTVFLKSQYIFAKLEPSKLILKNYPSVFKSVLLPLPPTGRTTDPYLQSL